MGTRGQKRPPLRPVELAAAFVELAFDRADDALESDIERAEKREGHDAPGVRHGFAFGFDPELGHVRSVNEDTLGREITRGLFGTRRRRR